MKAVVVSDSGIVVGAEHRRSRHGGCTSADMPSRSPSPSPAAAQHAAVVSDADLALVVLACDLRAHGYTFTTVTAATHARRWRAVGAAATARSLRDIFGWNLPFDRSGEFAGVAEQLEAAGALVWVASSDDDNNDVDLVRSAVRFTTIGGDLFVHSALPPLLREAVDLQPDTARFCRLLQQRITGPVHRLLDVGTGCGAAGISIATHADEAVLVDINPEALRFARVNAALAGVEVDAVESDGLHGVSGSFDLIVANPPYLGEPGGNGLAVCFVREALTRLAPGGRLILCRGAPIVDGVDLLQAALVEVLQGLTWNYCELEHDLYDVSDPLIERIAVVALEVSANRLVVVAPVDVIF